MIRKLLWVLVAAVALVGGAACGDDDDDSTADVDWSDVDDDVSAQVSAAQPSVESVEVKRDDKTLKFTFGVTGDDGSDDPSGFAMLAVEALAKDYPEVLDGVRQVQARIGENNYTYPYGEVQAWIDEGGHRPSY